MENQNNEIRRFGKSFRCAFDGLKYSIAHEKNFQIELIIAVLVLSLILILDLKNWEAIVLILMIMWVLITELINTVVERMVDILKPRIHPYAHLVKDIMAAVVLISCFAAVIIGIIIFYPYFKSIWI